MLIVSSALMSIKDVVLNYEDVESNENIFLTPGDYIILVVIKKIYFIDEIFFRLQGCR